MKLNKTEVEAIARRIVNNIIDAQEEKVDKLDKKDDIANMEKALAIKDAIVGLDKVTKSYLAKEAGINFKGMINLNQILRNLRTSAVKIKKRNSYTYSSDIIDDLVIAQIDATTVKELITKVTKKYLP
ncbi:MAG: hypothetical protein DRH26_00515 [Deltaproteobacteria bacterium]|nr:MAG: hypothetical protein DRH26_00515 [Deltaproteobacteria bacterium]